MYASALSAEFRAPHNIARTVNCAKAPQLGPLLGRPPFDIPVSGDFPVPSLKRLHACILLILLCSLLGCAQPAQKEPTTGNPADLGIISRVKTALSKEPLLKTAEINVEAREGVVQLTGIVASRAEMDIAVELASRVNGVKSVLNDMQLK